MRPVQALFDMFARHLEESDATLSAFCSEHDLELRENPLRQPGRDIHQKGNPELIFGITLDGYWLHMEYQHDLSHNVGVVAIYHDA